MGRLVVGVFAVLVGCGVSGCGSSAPKTVRVSGVVEFDGKPLTKGTISFLPQSASDKERARPATGTIDSSGRYTLSTFAPGDGALPGKYLVAVVCNTSEPSPEEIAEKGATIESLIPAGYNSPATSGLTATVNDVSEEKLDFKLTADGAPKEAPKQNPGGPVVDEFGT